MIARISTVLAVLCLGTSARSQVLFEEGFDSEASANVQVNQTADTLVQFVDYSSFTLGATAHSIIEAPNTIPGSAATRGVVIQANLTAGESNAINLIALDDVGESEFSGNYRVTFDMYLSVDPTANSESTGTTHQGGFGVGTDGTVILSRINRGNGPTGTWGWIATEGGYNFEDATIYEGAAVQTLVNNVGNASLFEDAFPNGSPLPLAPNNTWTEVDITVVDGQVSVKYNGIEFFSVPSNSTDGAAVLIYEDPFNSLSFSHDYQFGLFDNWKVEVAIPPTTVFSQTGPFLPVNDDAATSTGTFTIENTGDDPVTLNEVNFTGADSAAFALDTGLPLVVPAGETATVNVTFTASGERGVKTAQIEFVSTDAIDPSIALPLEAIFAHTLLAHYKLDETSGNVVTEASGNGPDGAFEVRDPLVYAAEGLAGGTSIGFTGADTGASGCYPFMRPLHVPTTSISLWIKPEAGSGGEDTLFNRDPGFTGADIIYGCFVDDLGILTYRSGGQITLQSADGAIVDGQTQHIVITHLDEDGFGNTTATRARMYIDGIMVAENTAPTGFDAYPSNSSTRSLHFATRTAAGSGFDGLMDDLQIYSIEIQPSQVANMFSAPGVTALDPIPDLVFTDISYHLDESIANLTWDSLPGKNYLVEHSDDLTVWEELDDSVESQGSSTTYQVIDAKPGPEFFRVREQ